MLFCSIVCFSDVVLFYHMFQWWCFVLLYDSVLFFVLLHVSAVVLCSIRCFSGDVLFYFMFQL